MINSVIDRSKIKTMQKDIKAAKTKKVEIKNPPAQKIIALEEPIQKTAPTSSTALEKPSDMKAPSATQPIARITVPIQKPQPQTPLTNTERTISENKSQEPNNIKQQDAYREPIE